MTSDTSRRRLLRAAASAGAVGLLAGCLGGGSGNGDGGSSPSATATSGGGSDGSGGTPTPTDTPTDSPTDSPTPTDTPTPTPTPVPTIEGVEVVLEGAPNGLQKYKLTVTSSGSGTIASVTAELLTGEQFQVVGGGEGTSAVEVRAADIVDSVGEFSETKVLFRLTYEEPVPEADLALSVSTLIDDASESMDTERVSLSGIDG
jgi:hypothetical protein